MKRKYHDGIQHMVIRFNYSENPNFSACCMTQIPKEKGKIVFQNKEGERKKERGEKSIMYLLR